MTGAQIMQLREELGMSRADLARALNVAPLTLSNWEVDEPHGLGAEVLQGIYNAVFDNVVFDPSDVGAARRARVDRIAAELRLGLGSMLCYRLLAVARGAKGESA